MMNVELSPASLALFTDLAKDAVNWGGTPGLDLNVGTDAASRGNVTDLKKKGLITTFRSDGNTWVTFTDAGATLAGELGINLGRWDELNAELPAIRAELTEVSKLQDAVLHCGRDRKTGTRYLVLANTYRKVWTGQTLEGALVWAAKQGAKVASGQGIETLKAMVS